MLNDFSICIILSIGIASQLPRDERVIFFCVFTAQLALCGFLLQNRKREGKGDDDRCDDLKIGSLEEAEGQRAGARPITIVPCPMVTSAEP